MDKDELKGKVKDAGGRLQRQAGEWTGDEELQESGMRNQAEGKVQNAWGKVKEAGRDLKENVKDDKDDKDLEKDPAA